MEQQVVMNRAQLQTLRTLLTKVDCEALELRPLPDDVIQVTLKSTNGDGTTLTVDSWGQGRLT